MRVFCRFAVLLCILSPSQALAAPEVLPLDAEKLLRAQLESVPPFPAELVLAGKSEHWQSIVHQGEVVVAIYAAAPALLDISSPFPYQPVVKVGSLRSRRIEACLWARRVEAAVRSLCGCRQVICLEARGTRSTSG